MDIKYSLNLHAGGIEYLIGHILQSFHHIPTASVKMNANLALSVYVDYRTKQTSYAPCFSY